MNFSYLENHEQFELLYTACCEAEEFVLAKPDISATSARKAMEFIVKYIYSSFEPYPPYGCTVYDMIRDPRFQNQFADPSMLLSIDFIRKIGNTAVHQGSLNLDDAMLVLEHLHFLIGEFAIGIGLIQEYPEFKKPEPDVIGELLDKVHPDNLLLNLLPYVCEMGREDWVSILDEHKIKHIADLKDVPEALNNEEFQGFLRGFERSMKTEVAGILELLPLSSATESEWQARRFSVPKSSIARVECFVMAYIEDNQRAYTQKWTYYNEALGEKAAAYLQLVHPGYIPESMRSAYVKPDVADIGDDNEFIHLEDAVKQLLRYIVAENPRRRDLLSLSSWCKTNLEINIPAIRTSVSNNPDRAMYSKDKVHMGDKKFYVLLAWNKISLMRLRQMSGELGETLITMDRLADWGFAMPGSDAEKRAKERAQRRAAAEMQIQETQLPQVEEPPKRQKRKMGGILPEGEVPTFEIRDYIVRLDLSKWIDKLVSAQWCNEKLGLDYPLLISYEDRQYLQKRQAQRGETPQIYSRTICVYNNITYYVKRLKVEAFEQMKTIVR